MLHDSLRQRRLGVALAQAPRVDPSPAGRRQVGECEPCARLGGDPMAADAGVGSPPSAGRGGEPARTCRSFLERTRSVARAPGRERSATLVSTAARRPRPDRGRRVVDGSHDVDRANTFAASNDDVDRGGPRGVVSRPDGRVPCPRDRVGLEWTDRAEAVLAASNQPGEGWSTQRVAAAQPGRWRARLTAEEQALAASWLAKFPIADDYPELASIRR